MLVVGLFLVVEALGPLFLDAALRAAATGHGPLITPWGSLATLLWAERCRARGVHVPWLTFAVAGAVLVVLLLLATAPTLPCDAPGRHAASQARAFGRSGGERRSVHDDAGAAADARRAWARTCSRSWSTDGVARAARDSTALPSAIERAEEPA